MRSALLCPLVAFLLSCKPGGVGKDQELCAQAAVMYDRCEPRAGSNQLARDLELDRWASLCRAVLTGETAQMLPNTLELYTALDDAERAGLRLQAECTAAASTCEAYAACER